MGSWVSIIIIIFFSISRSQAFAPGWVGSWLSEERLVAALGGVLDSNLGGGESTTSFPYSLDIHSYTGHIEQKQISNCHTGFSNAVKSTLWNGSILQNLEFAITMSQSCAPCKNLTTYPDLGAWS